MIYGQSHPHACFLCVFMYMDVYVFYFHVMDVDGALHTLYEVTLF